MEKTIFELTEMGFQAVDISLDKSAAINYRDEYPVQLEFEMFSPKNGRKIIIGATAMIKISDLKLDSDFIIREKNAYSDHVIDTRDIDECIDIADDL